MWRKTGAPAFHLDIVSRFNQTWRNDDGTMHDHLKMYKDHVVVLGRIGRDADGPPQGPPGLLHPARQEASSSASFGRRSATIRASPAQTSTSARGEDC